MPLLADRTQPVIAMPQALYAVKAACAVMISDLFKVPGLAIRGGMHAY